MDLSLADTYMVIKYYFLLLILLSFEAFGASQESTWLNFQNLGDAILKSEESNAELSKKHQEFKTEQTKLEEMEYKENETDLLNTKVEEHLKKLGSNNFQSRFDISLNYLSFQKEFDFKNTLGHSKLVVTSNVYCIGGAYGIANNNYHYWIDGCAFYGKSNVGNVSNTITFQQDSLDTYGAKISPAAGIFVSKIKSELGLKLPLLYSHQKITKPSNTTLRENSEFQALASFYYRFPVDQWFFQMEFGKFLSQDTTLWGFGAGLSF